MHACMCTDGATEWMCMGYKLQRLPQRLHGFGRLRESVQLQ